jgi:hypothetical protein
MRLSGTGHPELDDPRRRFLVRVIDSERLELATEAGEAIKESMDTSMGTLTYRRFPLELLNTGRFMPRLASAGWFTVAGLLVIFMGSIQEVDAIIAVSFGVTSAVLVAWYERHRYSAHHTPISWTLARFVTKLRETNVVPQKCKRGPDRAVTVGKLYELYSCFQSFFLSSVASRSRNMYYLASNIVKPLTRPQLLSFSELVGPSQIRFFVSHYWGDPFDKFVESIVRHAQTDNAWGRAKNWKTISYWICSLSNNQHRVEFEVGNGDWRESSFFKALRSDHCRGTCMVLDSGASPLRRSWCLFEVLQTFVLAGQGTNCGRSRGGLLFCTSRGVLNSGAAGYDIALAMARRLSALRAQDATASTLADKTMIDDLIEEEWGFDCMNEFVRSNMKQALQSVKEHFLGDFTQLDKALGNDTPAGGADAPSPIASVTSTVTGRSSPVAFAGSGASPVGDADLVRAATLGDVLDSAPTSPKVMPGRRPRFGISFRLPSLLTEMNRTTSSTWSEGEMQSPKRTLSAV